MIFLCYVIPGLVGASTGSILLTLLSFPLTILACLLVMPLDIIKSKEIKKEIKLLTASKSRVSGTDEYNKRYMGLSS